MERTKFFYSFWFPPAPSVCPHSTDYNRTLSATAWAEPTLQLRRSSFLIPASCYPVSFPYQQIKSFCVLFGFQTITLSRFGVSWISLDTFTTVTNCSSCCLVTTELFRAGCTTFLCFSSVFCHDWGALLPVSVVDRCNWHQGTEV